MEGWWKDNLLEDTIDKYKKKGKLQNGRNLDPSSFLQHLNDGKDYLHYGVKIYVRRLFKTLNRVGHYALFKKADSNFNRALDAAKTAAEEKNKQQKRMAAAAERKATEQEGKLLEERQRLEDEAAKRSQQQLKLANFVAEEKRKQDEADRKAKEEQAAKAKEEQKRLAEEAEERQRQATKQKEEDARIEEEQRRLAEEKERNLLAEENRQRREPPSQLQVTIKESLRDKIYQQLAMVAGTDTSQLESYVPKEILELTDEEEENQWNAKKDAAAKFAITSVIEKLDEDGFAIDADEKAKITDFFTCLMENNYVFDMGFRVDYGNNSVKCLCPCW